MTTTDLRTYLLSTPQPLPSPAIPDRNDWVFFRSLPRFPEAGSRILYAAHNTGTPCPTCTAGRWSTNSQLECPNCERGVRPDPGGIYASGFVTMFPVIPFAELRDYKADAAVATSPHGTWLMTRTPDDGLWVSGEKVFCDMEADTGVALRINSFRRHDAPNGCPGCRGRGRTPEHRIEGGSKSCRWCNQTLTFNMMSDPAGVCDCDAAREAACKVCHRAYKIPTMWNPVAPTNLAERVIHDPKAPLNTHAAFVQITDLCKPGALLDGVIYEP